MVKSRTHEISEIDAPITRYIFWNVHFDTGVDEQLLPIDHDVRTAHVATDADVAPLERILDFVFVR